jgi:hypothetical protein
MMTRYDIQKEGRLARKEDGREAGVCVRGGGGQGANHAKKPNYENRLDRVCCLTPFCLARKRGSIPITKWISNTPPHTRTHKSAREVVVPSPSPFPSNRTSGRKSESESENKRQSEFDCMIWRRYEERSKEMCVLRVPPLSSALAIFLVSTYFFDACAAREGCSSNLLEEKS